MERIPDGLTRAEQEAFMQNYSRERSERENHESDDRDIASFTIFFVPVSFDGPYSKTAAQSCHERARGPGDAG